MGQLRTGEVVRDAGTFRQEETGEAIHLTVGLSVILNKVFQLDLCISGAKALLQADAPHSVIAHLRLP